ncbi:myb-like protein J [Cucumis sativus]|uniref:myb-like protein J n=1 Tax=Cucumis sativus TaxID=3659 RepID=UPI0012F4A4E5|nr:myb-like protein J [Cucumis sativus]KAE8649106.1 hypothetical protein Csa_015417 [Cucumis sativus]
MAENKNVSFPHSSGSSLHTPTSPYNFDQNSVALSPSIDDNHEMSLGLEFSSCNWINNVGSEQLPTMEETSLRRVNHSLSLTNPNGNFETTQYYPSFPQFNVLNDNFETPQFYHPAYTQFNDPNNNYNNMGDAFLCSPSTLSTTHNSSNDSIRYNNGFLSDVVNSNSTKTTMTFENGCSFDSNLNNPSLFHDPQTSHFCSPSTFSMTHNNGQFADSTSYTGLLSDIPTQMIRPHVPTISLSTTNLLPSSSLPPQPLLSQNSLKIRNNSTNWSIREHKLFLAGMQLLGQGAWKKIANYVVITKTHTQVASHAQKYFLRQTSPKHKRTSIHDITTAEPEFFALAEARIAQHMKRLNNKDQ